MASGPVVPDASTLIVSDEAMIAVLSRGHFRLNDLWRLGRWRHEVSAARDPLGSP